MPKNAATHKGYHGKSYLFCSRKTSRSMVNGKKIRKIFPNGKLEDMIKKPLWLCCFKPLFVKCHLCCMFAEPCTESRMVQWKLCSRQIYPSSMWWKILDQAVSHYVNAKARLWENHSLWILKKVQILKSLFEWTPRIQFKVCK